MQRTCRIRKAEHNTLQLLQCHTRVCGGGAARLRQECHRARQRALPRPGPCYGRSAVLESRAAEPLARVLGQIACAFARYALFSCRPRDLLLLEQRAEFHAPFL